MHTTKIHIVMLDKIKHYTCGDSTHGLLYAQKCIPWKIIWTSSWYCSHIVCLFHNSVGKFQRYKLLSFFYIWCECWVFPIYKIWPDKFMTGVACGPEDVRQITWPRLLVVSEVSVLPFVFLVLCLQWTYRVLSSWYVFSSSFLSPLEYTGHSKFPKHYLLVTLFIPHFQGCGALVTTWRMWHLSAYFIAVASRDYLYLEDHTRTCEAEHIKLKKFFRLSRHPTHITKFPNIRSEITNAIG